MAINGDPDFVIAMTKFALELGMVPKYVITGTPGKAFEATINKLLKNIMLKDVYVKLKVIYLNYIN